MIDLYYWPTPNGQKISIALEEMGLAYQAIAVNIGKGDQFKPEFLVFSPNNRMPAIIDHDGPDGQPISVFESGAILLYLAAKTGQLMPDDIRAQTQVHEWLMWQMGGFGPMLGQAHHFNFYAPTRIDYAMTHIQANRLYGVLDKRLLPIHLSQASYSIADIAILPWTRSYEQQNVDINDYPYVQAARNCWHVSCSERRAVGEDWREDLKSISNEDFARLFGTEKKKTERQKNYSA